jgi:acid stress-induced BolA-like protein IbaG/YrbA
VISDTFRGKADSARQQMIWDALESAFGPQAPQHVGTLLAYTNDEWDIDLPAKAG